MAKTPQLTAEYVTAGSPYTIVVRIADTSVDDATWRAQVRDPNLSGDALAEFTIDAVAGTGEQQDKAILTLSLAGAVTRTFPSMVRCSLEQTFDDDPGEPLPLMRWTILVEPDNTYEDPE